MRKLSLLLTVAFALLIALPAKSQKNVNKVELKTLEDSAAYAIGMQFGQAITQNGLANLNIELIKKGLEDEVNGKSALDPHQYEATLEAFFTQKQKEENKEKIEEGEKFLEKNAKRKEVKTTASGLQYEVITEGTGDKPAATNTVKVHYKGTTIAGKVFDSSYDRGTPAEFPLNRVIAGWTEGLQLMSVGSKYKFYIPYNLAYGERGAGQDIKPFETLIFEVELLEIKK
ncbi:MAG: FKBP-type peptidyl-prolyl cis-trans isomerase [Bacteroidales bacterium]|nr:FKBP-type peptidyl-prolyl cis-trans isomerase [Bacteroidales bacterium]